jgi:hypothetical protein
MPNRYALVRKGLVEEVVIADEKYVPPSDMIAVKSDTANIGNKFDGNTFSTVVTPQTKNVLLYYASRKQSVIAQGGITVSLTPVGLTSPVDIKVDTNTTGRTDLTMLADQAKSDAGFTEEWIQDNTSYTLNAAHILQLSTAVQSFVSSTYSKYGAILKSIESGAITTTQQIDNPETIKVGTTPLRSWR